MQPAENPDSIEIGDVLTVTESEKWGNIGMVFRFAEITVIPGAWWCSCCFREIDGDKKAWERLIEKHRHKPKTKELEPA